VVSQDKVTDDYHGDILFQYALLIIECVCVCNRRHIKLITNWISSLWYNDDKDDDELRDEDIWDRDGDDNDNNETRGGPIAVASTQIDVSDSTRVINNNNNNNNNGSSCSLQIVYLNDAKDCISDAHFASDEENMMS
jgi:hypothetical protein